MELKWYFIAMICFFACLTLMSIFGDSTVTKSAWQINKENEMEKWRATVIKADSTIQVDSCIYRVTKLTCK